MDRKQINQLNMMDAVDQVMTTYNGTWSGNAAVSGIVATYRSHLSALNLNDALQKTISTGVTLTKEQALAAMVSAAILTCNAGKAYASVAGNTALYAQMKHTKTEITKAANTDADDICQNIHDNLNPYIASMVSYGATAMTQTNLQNTITTYSAMIGKPRAQIAIVRNATLTIEQHFTALNNIFKDQLDGVMAALYTTTNAPFYNEYVSTRVIVDIGHRHTVILKGFIYDVHNNALAGVLVELTGAAKHKKITDATGKYKFTRLHTGTYTLTISKAGFVTQTKTIVVTENGTIETDFVLVAVGGGGTAPTGGTTTGGTPPVTG